MTFYLKYRSKNFSEIDLQSVRTSLTNIVKSKNIPHAFLFAGPKGTGKTSAARILAKYFNCEKLIKDSTGKRELEPCNECSQCKSISKGENVDVIELDAASHRGIEDIRTLKETIKLASASAEKKIYIIDEAHMLTPEASNALLKTLEEPPSHVIFILATTNPEKLIPTIRSRTTLVQFNKATDEEIIRSLQRICKEEKIKCEKQALELIAQNSGGSFRDAIKTLESVLSQLGSVDLKSVSKLLLNNSEFSADVFVELLYRKKTKKLLDMLEDSSNYGLGSKTIYELIIKKLRFDLLSSVDKKDEQKIDDIIELIKLFSVSFESIESDIADNLGLEIAVIQWCGCDDDQETEIDENIDREENGESKKMTDQRENINSDAKDKEVSYQKTVVTNTTIISDDLWGKILSTIRPKNASTEALLRAARPIDFDGKKLTLGVFYSFHKEKLEISPHRIIVEDAISSLVGCPVRVFCTLSTPPPKSKEQENASQKMTDNNVVLTETDSEDIIEAAEKMFSKGGVPTNV